MPSTGNLDRTIAFKVAINVVLADYFFNLGNIFAAELFENVYFARKPLLSVGDAMG